MGNRVKRAYDWW